MILQTLKSNRSLNLFIFPVIGILFWLKELFAPHIYPFFTGENSNILYAPIYKLTYEYSLIQILFSLILVIFIAFLIQQVNDRFSVIRVRTKLPATIYILIIAGFTPMHVLHPVYFAAIFMLFAIYSIFGIFNNPNPFPEVFNAGFFIGIGSLFYFNLITVLPAFFIGIIILYRDVKWREFVILFLGFSVPFILALGFAFYFDRFLETLYIFEQNVSTSVNHIRDNYLLYGFLAFLMLLTLIGSIKLMQQYDSRKVSSRKYFSLFMVIFIFSLIGFVFIPATSQEMLVLSVIPITFLISNLFVTMESRFWSESLFLLLVVVVVFMEFSDQFF